MITLMGHGNPHPPKGRNCIMSVRIDQLYKERSKARQDRQPMTAIVLENEPGKLS